jgi:Mg-chelatase subunit ChlD
MSKGKDIEKIAGSRDSHVSIFQKGIEISHKGEPVKGSAMTGYVYMLVDRSASMEGNKLKQAKKGALNFAKDALAKGYFTGLIQFDSAAKLVCEPYKDISVLEKGLEKLEVGDTTHIAKAINLAHSLLKDMSGNRVMVIVTDGMPNGPGDPQSSLKAGEDAKRNGIDIIAIGTDDADEGFLKRLASRSQLGVKVESSHLEKTITDSAKLLPPGTRQITKK